MATIEERAHQYATKKVGGWYTGGFKGSIWQASYDTYIEIATEQRKIDIEKACHALENVVAKDIEMQGEYITLELINDLIEEIKQ